MGQARCGVETCFCATLYFKNRNICQDRLGTNIGTVENDNALLQEGKEIPGSCPGKTCTRDTPGVTLISSPRGVNIKRLDFAAPLSDGKRSFTKIGSRRTEAKLKFKTTGYTYVCVDTQSRPCCSRSAQTSWCARLMTPRRRARTAGAPGSATRYVKRLC